MFETARLRLREYRPSDEPFFLALFNDYDVLLNISSTYIAPSAARALEIVAALTRIPVFVVAECKATGAPLGFANVSVSAPQNGDGTLGITIAKDWWGKGYGTEIMQWLIAYAFKVLGLRRLTLQVFSSNPGAVALYEHVGFKHEGRQREAIWKEGKWVDVLWMGILAREYYAGDASASQKILETDRRPVPPTRASDVQRQPPDWVLL
ncbi:hypothetical protein HYPSUDRAFT_43000 [Hypholoma sublateritium FD-334 SS-4]|uniref:N-acetyltransferase domain-containing protein n=1 Tax=Hypholoma sublateritium (strain FD-334 SS-4) TaxID=945553 RepID=A0A0D2L1C6_HYPSF|nr:hypothetical protein HYPSUDRAFT_43000 [Hypholoma sublateritium FD-334 SS-4]